MVFVEALRSLVVKVMTESPEVADLLKQARAAGHEILVTDVVVSIRGEISEIGLPETASFREGLPPEPPPRPRVRNH